MLRQSGMSDGKSLHRGSVLQFFSQKRISLGDWISSISDFIKLIISVFEHPKDISIFSVFF